MLEMASYHQLYYQKNKERMDAQSRIYAKKNRDRIRALASTPKRKASKALSDKEWAKKNRLRSRQIKAEWQKRNRLKRSAAEAARRMEIARATPKWADKKAIKAFYLNRPKGMTVDHIYPIRSDVVCGLHVLENLQYLTPLENVLKRNLMPSCGLNTQEPQK